MDALSWAKEWLSIAQDRGDLLSTATERRGIAVSSEGIAAPRRALQC